MRLHSLCHLWIKKRHNSKKEKETTIFHSQDFFCVVYGYFRNISFNRSIKPTSITHTRWYHNKAQVQIEKLLFGVYVTVLAQFVLSFPKLKKKKCSTFNFLFFAIDMKIFANIKWIWIWKSTMPYQHQSANVCSLLASYIIRYRMPSTCTILDNVGSMSKKRRLIVYSLLLVYIYVYASMLHYSPLYVFSSSEGWLEWSVHWRRSYHISKWNEGFLWRK